MEKNDLLPPLKLRTSTLASYFGLSDYGPTKIVNTLTHKIYKIFVENQEFSRKRRKNRASRFSKVVHSIPVDSSKEIMI